MPRRKAKDTDAATDALDVLDMPPPAAPELLSGGTYAIYRTPDGGFMLVVEDQAGRIERKHISGGMVRLLTRGPLKGAFAQFMGGAPQAIGVEDLADNDAEAVTSGAHGELGG